MGLPESCYDSRAQEMVMGSWILFWVSLTRLEELFGLWVMDCGLWIFGYGFWIVGLGSLGSWFMGFGLGWL